MIPTFSPEDVTTSWQLRPDKPRVRDGKSVKYETAAWSRIICDVPPRMLGAVSDPSVPLWPTEGVKCGDALTSCGCCAVSMIEVWMFRRKASELLLPCSDSVALEGRWVCVVFGSDVMREAEVALALQRLVSDLESRGADVQVIYLDEAPDASKQGVDDYFAAGGMSST